MQQDSTAYCIPRRTTGTTSHRHHITLAHLLNPLEQICHAAQHPTKQSSRIADTSYLCCNYDFNTIQRTLRALPQAS
jgi:hypothetical protein